MLRCLKRPTYAPLAQHVAMRGVCENDDSVWPIAGTGLLIWPLMKVSVAGGPRYGRLEPIAYPCVATVHEKAVENAATIFWDASSKIVQKFSCDSLAGLADEQAIRAVCANSRKGSHAARHRLSLTGVPGVPSLCGLIHCTS